MTLSIYAMISVIIFFSFGLYYFYKVFKPDPFWTFFDSKDMIVMDAIMHSFLILIISFLWPVLLVALPFYLAYRAGNKTH